MPLGGKSGRRTIASVGGKDTAIYLSKAGDGGGRISSSKASNKAGRSVQSLLLLSSSFASAIAAEGRIIQSGRPLGGNEKESFH